MIITDHFTEMDIKAFWIKLFEMYGENEIRDINCFFPSKKSVVFTWDMLDDIDSDVAFFISKNIEKSLEIAKSVLIEECSSEIGSKNNLYVRIVDLPSDMKIPIHKIRNSNLGSLISVSGLVRKASNVNLYISNALFRCSICGHETWEETDSLFIKKPSVCQIDGCKGNAYSIKLDRNRSIYKDIQDGELQESPEGLTGGRQPQSIRFIIRGDAAGKVTVGSRVILNGFLRYEDKRENDELSVTSYVLEVLSIESEEEETDELRLTEEDLERIYKYSQSSTLLSDISRSIAPSICGYDHIKEALALQLVGGTQVQTGDGTTKRGDIHILMVGDPGVAKSQLLKSVSEIASRSVFTSGKSASAAGLTASAAKELNNKWTVEAGALVLADGGIACVDELDKMRSADRDALHDAMESQKIYFSKAGITMTLRTKCSLLAAANPKYGRFDVDDMIASQIELPPSLISRFDLIFVMLDTPNEVSDEAICSHILSAHMLGQIRATDHYRGKRDLKALSKKLNEINPIIPLDDLRKYIAYARKIKPVLTRDAKDVIDESFMRIRKMYNRNEKILGITFRQLDGYIRLATACAKLHLRDDITADDAEVAVRIIENYLGSIASLDGKSDIDMIMGSVASKDMELISSIKELYKFSPKQELSVDEIIMGLAPSGYEEKRIRNVIQKMLRTNDLFAPSYGIQSYRLRGSA